MVLRIDPLTKNEITTLNKINDYDRRLYSLEREGTKWFLCLQPVTSPLKKLRLIPEEIISAHDCTYSIIQNVRVSYEEAREPRRQQLHIQLC